MPAGDPEPSVEERLSALEKENQRLRLKMRFLKTKELCAPAVFSFPKTLVRTKFSSGAKLDSPEDGTSILGFEFKVTPLLRDWAHGVLLWHSDPRGRLRPDD